jgi:endonuclease/exonuclease/phosphatase family metal-dependent hydrolase
VLSVVGTQTGHFANLLSVPTPVGPVIATRGWASVDLATAAGTVRVVDTHLEALSGSYAAEQAQELVTGAGPADTTLPVIVAGDLNSGPGTTVDAYNVIAGALTDAWPVAKPNDPGLTWALHGEDFNSYQTAPDRRIDVVLERGLQPLTDMLVGTSDLTPSGLYPSDHAGVVARLAIGP